MEQKINEIINNMPDKEEIKDFSLQVDSKNCVNLSVTIQICNLTSNFKIKKYAISSKSDKNLIVNTKFKCEKNYEQKSKQMELYYTLPLQNIDAKTLKYIPATLDKYYCRGNLFHKYYADKNGFYYIDFTKKPYILKLKTNDLTGLMVFDDIFAKTEKEVFFMGKRVSGVNAQTFKPVYNDIHLGGLNILMANISFKMKIFIVATKKNYETKNKQIKKTAGNKVFTLLRVRYLTESLCILTHSLNRCILF